MAKYDKADVFDEYNYCEFLCMSCTVRKEIKPNHDEHHIVKTIALKTI